MTARSRDSRRVDPRHIAEDGREIILLGVVGMSPAVITETIWALAHPLRGVKPVIPHKVRLITTTLGEQSILKGLFEPAAHLGGISPKAALQRAIFDRYRYAVGRLQFDDPLVIIAPEPDSDAADTRPLTDICSPEDSEAAADFILDEVRKITENRDTLLIATLAGGRKTMGALLYASMSLIGRECDRITHVLVNEPFEQPLVPPFYFPPSKPIAHELRDRSGNVLHRVSSKAAKIELAYVPFVPLRNRILELPEKARVGSFKGMVREYSRVLRADRGEPVRVRFPADGKSFLVEDVRVDLENRTQLHFIRWLCEVREKPWLKEQLKAVVEFFRAGHALKFDPGNVPAEYRAALNAYPLLKNPVTPLDDAHATERMATRALNIVRSTLKPSGLWPIARRSWVLPPCKVIEEKQRISRGRRSAAR
jgi:CRISPR-associated protein (TIGR02584 family)